MVMTLLLMLMRMSSVQCTICTVNNMMYTSIQAVIFYAAMHQRTCFAFFLTTHYLILTSSLYSRDSVLEKLRQTAEHTRSAVSRGQPDVSKDILKDEL